ncbi:MAG TPA: helix-turn-helix domain-containing protein [Acidimicrobiales bacterium]|nr:helix-turn-helix domain-containing protein [Acidimicrobiales bacterium]
MSPTVNPARKYDASRRQEQARATRRAVLAVATRMFLDQGYAATTMNAVAEAAGVSVETIYKTIGKKPALVKACFDVAIAGDDEDLPIQERESLLRVRSTTDPREKLRLYGEHMTGTMQRVGAILLAVRAAAATDAGARDVWAQLQEERLRGMTMLATSLKEIKALRKGVSVEEARDVLWVHNSVEVWDLLVNGRGWSNERYGKFVGAQLIAALL